ncbi:MAG: DUF5685 family protein [Clostridia bacterium]
MYGYINIDKDTLNEGERGLFNTFMCGMCLSTKNLFGNLKRLTVGFDINLFNVLFHSFLDFQVTPVMDICAMSPIKKRPLIMPDEISDSLSVGNILLMYYNLKDDVNDENSIIKRIVLSSLKKSFLRAKNLNPPLQRDIECAQMQLLELEKDKCIILDEVCHPFAELSKSLATGILKDKSNKYIENLCYNLGKWVYLIDALDDLKKDVENKNYNPLLSCFEWKGSIEEFVITKYDDLQFVFYTTLNKIAECFNDLQLVKYYCILKNVFYVSLRKKTESIFDKYTNCKV